MNIACKMMPISLGSPSFDWGRSSRRPPFLAVRYAAGPAGFADEAKSKRHAYADLSIQFEIFCGYLDLWRLEKGLQRKRTVKPATVAPSPEAAPATIPPAPAAAKPRRTKLRVVALPAVQLAMVDIAPPAPVQLSMAELLRSYGHVREVPPC